MMRTLICMGIGVAGSGVLAFATTLLDTMPDVALFVAGIGCTFVTAIGFMVIADLDR